jgi:chromosome partitioning protein
MLRLVISNQRGGVSKTTTTATLARFFGDQGLRVLAVDADPQGSLGLVLGLRPPKYLHDFVVHNCPLEECAVTAAPNVDVLCGNRDTVKVEVTLLGTMGREFALSRLFSRVERSYDVVLIDVAPSINLVQTCSIMYAKRLLIPVAMDMLSLQGAVACCETARLLADVFQTDIRPVALLPVKVDRRFSLTDYMMRALQELSEKRGIPLLNAIRTDGTVPKAERAKKFLVDYDPECKALEDYTAAANRLVRLPDVKQDAEHHQEVLSA